MANTVTLTQLKQRCRERADVVNSSFITDAELLSHINSSYAELYDILVSSYQDYYVSSSTASVTTGNTIALPTDFYKMIGLDVSSDGVSYYTVKKFNFNQRNSSSNDGVRYRVAGSNILLEPSDSAVGTYKIWYIPVYTPLASSSDVVNGIMGWDEYIVIDVAIKILQKEESSTSSLEKAKDAIKARIIQMSSVRDVEPDSITNIYGTECDDIYYI